jgi:Putative DNA-binding domain
VSDLASIQLEFQNWVLDKADASVPDVDKAYGLKIYHHAYRARIREALGETFEKTWSWLGDNAFDLVVADYLDLYPPEHSSLDRCGERFAAFLECRYPDDPEICEIALIEWALHICFSGPDEKPVNLAHLGELDWERAIFTLVPTYAEISLRTNAAAIWRALDENSEPPLAHRLTDPVRYRFWRKGFSPHFTAMDKMEHRALTLIQQGVAFSLICEALVTNVDCNDHVATKMAGYLSQWSFDEIIAQVK